MSYVQGVSVFASAYSLVAFSADRCEAMYRDLGSTKGLTKQRAKLVILFIWIIGFLLMSPCMLVFEVHPVGEMQVMQCLENWPTDAHGKYFYLICNLIGCYVFPLSLVAIFNVFVWFKVSRRGLSHHSTNVITGIARIHSRTKKNVRKSLSVVTLAFMLCWLPLYIIVTRIELLSGIPITMTENNVLRIIIPFAQLLGSFNSSINPIIYAFLNPNFRKACVSVLFSVSEYNTDVSKFSSNPYGRGTFSCNLKRQGSVFV